ncbi:MAG: N-acetylglucosamine-6-phosphate deacetylase [Microbacterium sp.]|uniref:N-acetylglucosamine-6-phosphate deacetylase n=1 Tax=Microbacterium sp. TaxID=51671 RepID=UPI001ACB9DC4|nr:N-acetylglucosamine-6-phosphate deacetylase [Microbacterium sp.]MBN9173319.1 N-acetylglucosamine-6-phosphate deacetylase [Microbacterium sp.]
MPILGAGRVATSTAVHSPGWIEHVDGRIVGVGAGRRGDADLVLPEATVVPGFVDIHVHGGGGGSYTDLDEGSVRRARAAHLAHGTTTTMASLVTADLDRLLASVALLADLADEGVIRGIHLEGPWISPVRGGAHDHDALRAPRPADVERLLATGRGAVRMVTIAPELPGGLDAVRRITAAGAIAAVGHTDATYAQTLAAIEAGARVATHLFNAMRPLHHREPGPVLALASDPDVTLEMIADGTHLHPALYREVVRTAGADRVALVTDAMAAAGLGDGEYRLGALAVSVHDGVAHVAGTDIIAGSTTTMDALFRAALGAGEGSADGRPTDAAWLGAVRQTATTPARAMGWDDVGDLAPGRRADAVVLDADARVTGVIVAGDPVASA